MLLQLELDVSYYIYIATKIQNLKSSIQDNDKAKK
jgi:hypothetical protein